MMSAPARYDVRTLHLLGGNLSLDFVNTVVWRLGPEIDDTLRTYDDLLAFAERTGTLSAADVAALAKRAEANPAAAERALATARELREAIYRVFVGHDDGQERRDDDLETIVKIVRQSGTQLLLVPPRADEPAGHRHEDGTYRWDWPPVESLAAPLDDDAILARPLWDVATAAANLLTLGPLERVRQCSGRHCGWLFLDTTKNGRRRWCDSAVCGNRARVRAHYHRHHGASADDEDDSAA